MDSLGTLAKGIYIGNNSLASFLEITKNSHASNGLFDKVSDWGVRKHNIKKNFPRTASYYYTLQKMGETTTDVKRYFFGNLVSGDNIDGLDIGWAYTTDINEAGLKNTGYASVADFAEFQRLLRGEALIRGAIGTKGRNIHVKTKYSDYNLANITIEEYENDENLGVRSINIGDSYVVGKDATYSIEHKVLKDTHSDYAWEKRNDFYSLNGIDIEEPKKDYSDLSPVNELLTFTNNKPIGRHDYKTIDNVKELIHGILEKKPSINEAVKLYGDKCITYGRNPDFTVTADDFKTPFEPKEFKLEDLKSFIYSGNTGGLSGQIYNNVRTHLLRYSKNVYNNISGYGISGKTNNIDYYKVEEDPKSRTVNNGVTFTIDESNSLLYEVRSGITSNRLNKLIKDLITGTSYYSVNNNNNNNTWSRVRRYSKMKDLIRPFYGESGTCITFLEVQQKLSAGMRPGNGATHLTNNSVLQNNGFVRINPSQNSQVNGKFIQNYMFSIENLAWQDRNSQLSKEQLGPNKGRIMWFPPYNLKFSENVNVNWNANNFIGRGEQIYTYTNTERGGTLDFTLLIDHPSILNEWRGTGDDTTKREKDLLDFFAGKKLLEKDALINDGKVTRVKETSNNTQNTGNSALLPNAKRFAFVIFYPNNYPTNENMAKKDNKQLDLDAILKELSNYEKDTRTNHKFNKRINKNKFALNTPGTTKINEIKEILGDNLGDLDVKFLLGDIIDSNTLPQQIKYVIGNINSGNELFGMSKDVYKLARIDYYGGNTKTGTANSNKTLNNNRIGLLQEIVEKKAGFDRNSAPTFYKGLTEAAGTNIDDINSKMCRMAAVVFSLIPKDITPTHAPSTNGTIVSLQQGNNNNNIKGGTSGGNVYFDTKQKTYNSTYNNEYLYFKEVDTNESLKQSILSQVKHFNPAFHSLTPEGFNARLTFLHQCTRQGPTSDVGSNGMNANELVKFAGNLSFGRAPYCILRIGDFFNTKICIDSMSINYDNGGGTQWDLNPEGAGVQPMMANISLNFKFVGGQDISGPIEKLQNAISSNYYANTSVYDAYSEINNNKQ